MHEHLQELDCRIRALELLLQGSGCALATKHDLDQMERRIMGTITEFKARFDPWAAKLEASVDGLTADVQWMKGEIERLQSTQGTLSAEDQAIVDGIQARLEAAVTKAEALDAMTGSPPTP